MARFEVLGARGQIGDPRTVIEYLQHLGKGEGLALDADMICGKAHVISAVTHAIRAFERGDNISGSLAVETVLYASGEHQISKAMKKMGIKIGTERVALILIDSIPSDNVVVSLSLKRDDEVLEPSDEKALRFGITKDEIRAVPANKIEDLVLEKVAFVALSK